MLSIIINIFNGAAYLAQAVYLGSYQIGKLITLSFSTILDIVLKTFLGLTFCIKVIFEDFYRFIEEINYYVVKMSMSLQETFVEIYDKIATICKLFMDEYIRFVTTGKIQINNIGNAFKIGAQCLLQNIYGALCLLGNIMWFIVTLIPNIIYYMVIFVKCALKWIADLMCVIVQYIIRSIADTKATMMETLLSTPRQTITGLVILFLLIVNFRRTVPIFRRCYYSIRRTFQRMGNYIQSSIYMRLLNIWTQREIRAIERDVLSLQANETSDLLQSCAETTVECDSTNFCVICRDRKKTVVFFPCRHLCACMPCSISLMSYTNSCPICRSSINGKCTVFT